MAQTLSEPGFLATNVIQHKFSHASDVTFIQKGVFIKVETVDCGNWDDECIHT